MTDKTGLKRQYKYVGESTKIAIGVVVAVIVIEADACSFIVRVIAISLTQIKTPHNMTVLLSEIR